MKVFRSALTRSMGSLCSLGTRSLSMAEELETARAPRNGSIRGCPFLYSCLSSQTRIFRGEGRRYCISSPGGAPGQGFITGQEDYGLDCIIHKLLDRLSDIVGLDSHNPCLLAILPNCWPNSLCFFVHNYYPSRTSVSSHRILGTHPAIGE